MQDKLNHVFAYIDELVAISLLIWAMGLITSRGIGRRFTKSDYSGIVSLVLMCLIGLLGNIVFGVQPSYAAVLIDIVSCTKFFIAFWSLTVISAFHDLHHAYRICATLSRAFVAILFVLMLINQFFDIGMSLDSRYGIKCFLFLSGHASNFAASVVCALTFLLGDIKKKKWYIFFALVVICASMRFKAIGFAAIVALELIVFRNSQKLTLGFVCAAIGTALYLALGQIDVYYMNDGTARSVLFRNAFVVADTFFPLGSGFASYGSFVTLANYVDLYESLGFGLVYGLTQTDPSYLADSFWPIVIGQFGFFGTLLFILLLVYFLRSIVRRQKKSGCYLWAAYAVPTYLLITSTSEPAFFNAYAVSLAFALVVVVDGSMLKSAKKGD